MIHLPRLYGIATALAAAMLLVACGSTSLSNVRNGQTELPIWPAVEAANPLEESKMYPNLDAIRRITKGMTKQEVYRLLGHPMYREGIVGVREWDYVFRLPIGTTNQHRICSFKLLWNDDMRATSSFWKPSSCADLVSPLSEARPERVPIPEAPATSPQAVKKSSIEVSADLLFDFDSATLSATAPNAIEERVIKVLVKAEKVDSLRVIGFTDRLGNDAYNYELSRRRAESVKDYLVSRGVPEEAVIVEGRGKAEPVIDCIGTNGPALTACLKPNRRVRVEVTAR